MTFTDQQADQGRSAYRQNCGDCHGENLNDGEFGGAPLKGRAFDEQWGEHTADVLFMYISTLMPPQQPGQLSDRTYANIMAFILRGNGYQSSGQELPTNPDLLEKMSLKK